MHFETHLPHTPPSAADAEYTEEGPNLATFPAIASGIPNQTGSRSKRFDPDACWHAIFSALSWLFMQFVEGFASYSEAMHPGLSAWHTEDGTASPPSDKAETARDLCASGRVVAFPGSLSTTAQISALSNRAKPVVTLE